MTNEQIQYVVDQLDAGYDRTAIESALKESGYDLQLIAQLFEGADARLKLTAIPPAESVEDSVDKNDVSLSTQHKTHVGMKAAIGLIAVVAVTIAGLTLASFAGFITLPSSLTNMFSSAPYGEENIIEGIMDGFAEIDSATYTLSLSMQSSEKDDDTYLLPEQLKEFPNEGFDSIFSILPEEFSIQGEIAGNFDISEITTPDSYVKISGEYKTDDFSFNSDVEIVLAKEEGMFIRINRMPSLLFLDFSSIKGDWIHVIDKPLDEAFLSSEDLGLDTEETLEAKAQIELILHNANKYNIFSIEGLPEKEKINDVTSYKYTLALEQVQLRKFFQATQEQLEDEYGDDHLWLDFEINKNIDLFTSAAYVDFLNTHTKMMVWTRSDGVPVRFGVENRIAVNSNMQSFDMFSQANRLGVDAAKKASINNMRAQAELYYDDNENSYSAFCSSEWGPVYRFDKEYVYECNDFAEAYVIEIILSDSSYCVDSTGFASDGSMLLVSDTVCSSKIKTPPKVDVEQAEADRQINVSLFVDLTEINESVVIDIPEEALTLEEASERFYFLGTILDSLEGARTKGGDAAVKASLNNMRAVSELYYDDNNFSYQGLCEYTASDYPDIWEYIFDCNAKSQVYAMDGELSEGLYCIDSTGNAGVSTFPLTEDTVCW